MPELTARKSQQWGFTDLEVRYVQELLRTGEQSLAQASCRISDDEVRAIYFNQHYDNLLRQQVSEVFGQKLIPLALARLQEFNAKGATPDRGQLDAVKTALDRAGMIAPKASEPEKHNLDMQEWSIEKLQEFVGIASEEIEAKRAPNAQPITPQVIDVLD